MHVRNIAEAIADRTCVAWPECGRGLHSKIRTVALNILSAHEPEARRLERDREIDRLANKGTCAMLRITIASLKLDRAKARRDAADVAVEYGALRLVIAEWESRTGLDHNALLTGTYKKPMGNQS